MSDDPKTLTGPAVLTSSGCSKPDPADFYPSGVTFTCATQYAFYDSCRFATTGQVPQFSTVPPQQNIIMTVMDLRYPERTVIKRSLWWRFRTILADLLIAIGYLISPDGYKID